MQAAHTLPMTVLTQDDVGWTWMSHQRHCSGTTPRRAGGTAGAQRGGAGAVPLVTQTSSTTTSTHPACVGASVATG